MSDHFLPGVLYAVRNNAQTNVHYRTIRSIFPTMSCSTRGAWFRTAHVSTCIYVAFSLCSFPFVSACLHCLWCILVVFVSFRLLPGPAVVVFSYQSRCH